MTSAFRIADVLVMLYDGAVVMQGTPEEFRESSNPAVQRFLQVQSTPPLLKPVGERNPEAET